MASGIGFMLIEMAMMQQLSLFLGHPIYSLVVVLTGLILATGAGSLASDRLRIGSALAGRIPAIFAACLITVYAITVVPVIHRFIAEEFWQRAAISLLLVIPCVFVG